MALNKTQARVFAAMLVAVAIGAIAIALLPAFRGGPRNKVVALDDPAAGAGTGAGGRRASAATNAGGPTTPAAVAGPTGVVVDAAGGAVADAEVILGLPGRFVDLSAAQTRGNVVRTDSQGRFAFPTGPAWSDVFVRAPRGFAHVRSDRMPADGTIVLKDWGRVEGTVRIGNRPAAGQQINLYVRTMRSYTPTANPESPVVGRPSANLNFQQSVRADADGHFAFAQVVPGPAVIEREATPNAAESRLRMRRFHPTAVVTVAPGATATVAVGGTGRPVVGTVKLDVPDGRLPLTGFVRLGVDRRASAALRVPPNWAALGEQERVAIVDAWQDAQATPAFEVPVTITADGAFRADDVPAGGHALSVSADSTESGMRIERVAEGTMSFTVPAIPGDRSDEPLDVGTVTVHLRPTVKTGQAAPPVAATTADGRTVRLSDFKGRYVLLSFVTGVDGAAAAAASDLRFTSSNTLRDRAGDRVAFLAVMLPNSASGRASDLPAVPGWTIATVVDWRTRLDPAYANSPGSYLVDPEGKVLTKAAPYDRGLYGLLDRSLGFMRSSAAGVVVESEIVAATSTTRALEFKKLPAVAKDDLGRRAVFSVVDGRKADFGGDLNTLTDGQGPRHERDEPMMCTFAPGTVEGRLRADLRAVTEVARVHTYAWYKDGHRWAQVYRLYGSDGGAKDFDPEPKIGTDPAAHGWTLVASVDTREAAGGVGLGDNQRGQSAVAVSGKDGVLGKYRYLLFVTFATETHNPWGQTFWSEIDIVGR